MEDFITQQLQNQFMTGGLVIVIFTAILAYTRNVPMRLLWLLKRRYVLTVDVADHDQAFYWIQKWLAEQPYSKKATLLTASTRVHAGRSIDVVEGPGGKHVIEVHFSPAPGFHLFRYKKHWILLTRTREKTESFNVDRGYREVFTFQTFARDRQVIIDLIGESRALAFPPEEKAVSVLKDMFQHWQVVMKRLPRSINTVVLQDGMDEDILGDIREFLRSGDWYREHGVPYQRGYLLHGPPGNGKTSLVHAVASETERDIYVLRMSSTTDDSMQNAMARVAENGIVLLEDVDCIFAPRTKEEADAKATANTHPYDRGKELTKSSGYLTLSGFLNAIDGLSAHEGRLLFMTTNFKDRLDPALIRPGRVDREFYLDNADWEQARRLFLQFFPKQSELATRFADGVGNNVSMAALQGHLIKHKNNPEAASKWDAKYTIAA